MPRKPTAYHRPQTLSEALSLLAQPNTLPLGGGTKLLASEEGLDAIVVDLQATGLNKVFTAGSETAILSIGATCTLAQLHDYLGAQHPTTPQTPFLQQALNDAGPNTFRNAATIGGTVAYADPDSELLAALLVLETTVSLLAPAQTHVTLAEYLESQAYDNMLIKQINVPLEAGRGNSQRVARTPKDYPIVSVTCWLSDETGGRLAATGVAERPTRLGNAETALQAGLTPEAISAASAAAAQACTHPGDFRGDAAYRAKMTAVLTRRALQAVI